MAIYFIAKVFTVNPRFEGSCLIKNGGNQETPWGTTNPKAHAHRFSRKEDALEALKRFFAGGGQEVYTSGRVHRVTEEPTGLVVGEGGAPLDAPEPASEPVEVEVAQATSSPFLEQAEAILAAAEACDLDDDSDHDEYQEAALFFYENARELLDAMRERDRLDWLRQHPESCRAAKDCRNKRAEGYIHCESCLKDGNAGGYFDVYRRHYVQVYNDAFEEILGRIAKQLGELSPPEEAGLPQDPESPPRPR